MRHHPSPGPPLPLLAIMRDAFALPWKHRNEVFRATSLPLLALIALTLCRDMIPWGRSVSVAVAWHSVHLIALSWLAVTVHRLVLLDEARASRFDRETLKRVAGYALVFAAIWIAYLLLQTIILNGVAIASGISYVPVGGQRNETAWQWLMFGSVVVTLPLIARCGLVLPSVAVDKGFEIKDAWRASRGNTWRLAVIFGVLPWAISEGIWFFYRDDASTLELAVFLVLGCVLAVVEVTALSLSYGALTAPAPRPIDPPA
jgi:hypothetical protein